MGHVRHRQVRRALPSASIRLAAISTMAAVGWIAIPASQSSGVAWNGTDPGSSAISSTGLTDNYGQFVNESVVTNTALSEYGTGTYLGNGWLVTALHVVSTSTYGTLEPGSSISVNIYGQQYTLDNYQTFGSSDIVLCHLAGYTSGTATTLPGVERSQIYTGSSETGNLEQLGGFGNHDIINSGTATNNQTFYRGFNIAYSDGGSIDVSATGNSRLVQDGYLLGYQQSGDSGSGLWMDNGPDQDLDLRDWSLIGALDTGTTPAYFGDGGQYARISSYAGTIINTVFPHAWLSWTSNASSTSAVDGSGTWNLASTNFTDGTNYAFNGPERTQIVTFGAGNGAAGTVTLGATVPVDQINFNAAGSGTYTIAGAGSYSISLGPDSIIMTNVNAAISANMSGGSNSDQGFGGYPSFPKIEKEGAATLTLTGNTTLNSGVAFYDRAGTVVIGSGGVFNVPLYTSVAVYTGETAALTVMGTGSFNSSGQDFNLADLGGVGVLNVQNSGSVNVGPMFIGKGSAGLTGAAGVGTVNQSGGTISTTSISLATNHPLSVGVYNLTAGTLNTASIVGGLGTSTFNFNGGTLQANANSTTFMQNLTAATINAAATINTGAYNVALNQPLTHATGAPATDGGLIKNGAGTLTLGGNSSYTGPTNINAGKVVLNPAGGASAVAISPVAWYSFDSVSGTTVNNTGTGGSAMNGTLTGNATISSGGRFGNALNLSSGGSMVVSNAITDMGGAADWTISAWVHTTTPGASILNKSDGTDWSYDNSVFYLGNGNGGGTGGIPSAVRYGRGFLQASSTSTSVDDGTWHMVTYVDAAGTYSIYTDGVLQSLSNGNSSFEQAVEQGGVVTFGTTVDTYAGDGTVNFTGLLDEVQIYNRPLGTGQVQRLYATNSPNPVAASSVLPSTTPVSLAATAALDLAGTNQSIGSLSGPAGSFVKLGGGQLTVSSSNSTTFSGNILGSGSLVKGGSGILILGGQNSYSGSTTISGGTVRLTTPASVTAATPIASFTFSHLSGNTVINDGSGGSSMNGTLNSNGGTGFITTTGGPAAGLGALVLNGDGTTVDINSGITDLSGSGTWTVSAWIKTTQAGATIFDKGNGSGWGSGYSTFYLGTGNNTGSGSYPDAVRYAGGWVAGATAVNDGSWHLVTYTDSAGSKAIYVDGVVENLSQNQFTTADTGSIVRIGFAPAGEGDGEVATSGSLSGINFFNSALSATQVASLYSTTLGGAPLPTSTPVTITSGATLDVNGITQTIGSLTGPSGAAVTLGTGTLNFNNAGTSTFSGVISSTGSIAEIGSGTQNLGGDDTYTGTTTVTTGTLNLGANQLTTGILVRNSAGITINAGKLIIGSAASHANRDLFVVGGSGLNISGATNAWTGRLDLGSNDIDIQNAGTAGLATITNQVRSGFAGGAWNGPGIDSAAAAAGPGHLTAIGVILNTDANGHAIYGSAATLGLFDGQNPGTSDVLVKYTYYGDANLDGAVDGSDYTLIDNGFVNHLTGWFNGDFNYDGIVDGSDYTLIDNAFNTQQATLGSNPLAIVAATTAQIVTTAVPEPTTLGVVTMTGIALMTRRRRTR